MTQLQIILSLLCALVAVVLAVHVVRDQQVGNVGFVGLVVIEVGLLVQLVWGLVLVADDRTGLAVATYVGYLLGALVVLPVGYLWSAAEKSRSGTGVLLVAVLVVPVLFLRLHDIWAARG